MCVKSGSSLVAIILGMSSRLRFISSTGTTICTGTRSYSSGTDYITIYGECISPQNTTWTEVVIEDSSSNPVMNVKFPGINVLQGWRLYTSIRLRWA